MRILVAEDDEALGKFVRRGLEAEHYAVDVSATGDQVRDLSGVRAWRRPSPDWEGKEAAYQQASSI